MEREDFKISIGSLNNKFPYTVEGLLNILQQHNMAANGNKECKPKSHMLGTEVGEKRQVKLESNNIFETSYESDLRV